MRRIIYRLFHPSPRGKLRWTAFLVFLLFLVSLGYSMSELYAQQRESLSKKFNIALPVLELPAMIPPAFRLGLDLRGGTHLVYNADVAQTPGNERDTALEGARDVIERRVNMFGVAEPVVQTVKAGEDYRIIVELAGVKDVNQAIKMIGDTPLLEFKEQSGSAPEAPKLTDAQKKELSDFNARADAKAADALKRALTPGSDFAALAKELSEDESSKEKGGDIGFASKNNQYAFFIPHVETLKDGEMVKTVVAGADGGVSIVKIIGRRQTEKEVAANHILICFKGATSCDKETSKEDAKKQLEALKKQATPANFVDLAKKNSTEPGADKSGGDLGYFGKGMMVKEFEDVVFSLPKGAISDIVETQFGFHVIFKRDERPLPEYQIARIFVKKKTEAEFLPPPSEWKQTALTGKQLKRAAVQFDQNTQFPEVSLEFDEEGKKLFAEITERNVGKPVAIFLDGQPISIPRVQQPIRDGHAVIQGDFDLAEAKLLTQRLNAGALPIPITLISQQTVGASLGEESLQKSTMAGLIGFLLVALFMIGFYRLPGLLAVIALCIYTALVLSIFKLSNVTLTLSGIAGFILSVGMAVDANILIFERMKEELRWGKLLNSALKDGFKRAWTSIRDSNVASLITCTILFFFSTSLIKGFALTLAIGIALSMFSAIVITRLLLLLVSGTRLRNSPWLFGASKDGGEKI